MRLGVHAYLYLKCFLYVHFFACPKKRTKERANNHLAFGCPALLLKRGRFGKSLAFRRIAFPLFTALLGCVKYLKICFLLILFANYFTFTADIFLSEVFLVVGDNKWKMK